MNFGSPYERKRRGDMPVARERLRCRPPSESYGNRAPIPPWLYQSQEYVPQEYVRVAQKYGLNWGLVRDNPNHIGYVRHVTPGLAEKIRTAVEAEEKEI
jgi:hypothetical protein